MVQSSICPPGFHPLGQLRPVQEGFGRGLDTVMGEVPAELEGQVDAETGNARSDEGLHGVLLEPRPAVREADHVMQSDEPQAQGVILAPSICHPP